MRNIKTKIELFVSKNTNIFITILFFIFGSVLLHTALGINTFSIWTIGISAIVILILGRIKVAEYLFSTIGVIIIALNLIVITLSFVPDYNKKVDITGFYDQQKNYIKVDIQDDAQTLSENKAKVIIINKEIKNAPKRELDLTTPNINNKEIELMTGDIVLFQSKSKKINSVVNLYLWDGSIIRVLPQTNVKLEKLLKNTKDLFSSQTQVNVEKGSIWFNVIKTIKDDNSFRIKTKEGTIVIRGTAGFISENSEDGEMTVYSVNHIIQIINNEGKSEIIGKLQSMALSGTNMKEISLGQLSDLIGSDYVQKLKDQTFIKMDNEDIQAFKTKIQNYVKQEFGWIFDGTDSLEKVGEFKLKLFSIIDENAQKSLENFNKYQILKGEADSSAAKQEMVDGLLKLQDQQDAIFVPINQSMESMKMKFLQTSAAYNFEQFKTYVINYYNRLLDQGKSIDINKIKDIVQNGESNMRGLLFELENKIQELGN